MSQKTKTALSAILIIGGLSVVLKMYSGASFQDILFILLFGLVSGLIAVIIRGYFNPPAWLYKIRSFVFGAFYGVSLGILDFGSELINGKAFIWNELLVSVITGIVVGVVLYPVFGFFQRRKLQMREALLPPEELLLKDFVLLINADGVKTAGKLILTTDHLFFLPNKKGEKPLERAVHEIHADISRTRYFGIPNGFRIENSSLSFQLPFPFYWLKTVRQIRN